LCPAVHFCSSYYRIIQQCKLRQLPGDIDCVDVNALTAAEVKLRGNGRHVRFSMYCVKPEALNLPDSMIYLCTTQTCAETSTATHVDSSKHMFRQSDNDVYGYKVPCSDATPSFLAHISHRSKHNQSLNNNNLHHGYRVDNTK